MGATPIVQRPPPQVEGGNITIVLDEDEYIRRIEASQFSIIGMLFKSNKTITPSNIELKAKLANAGVWIISI